MNSIAKIAKKAVSSVVVTSTVLWSMGASMLVGPLTAHAAVADGTLIKAKEVGAVYYYKGGKRWTFPNEKTYKTWYKDFSSVQIIPLSELQTYQLAGNATYRAGTRLVKITTDPKVYAVEPGGKLRWIKDEATAKALYGNDWAKRVDDVADAFFTNYTIGADLQGNVLPDGSLVKSGAEFFYIEGGKKRAVDAAALAGNNFNTAFALSADVSSYAAGAALGASEVKDLAGGSMPSQPGQPSAPAGSLSISLASDSPVAGSLVADATEGGQRMAKMLKANFTATGGEVKVTEVRAKRQGISKDGDVDTLFLADANGNLLGKNSSFSSGVAVFTNSAGLFTVPAGQTVSVWLLEDVNKSAAAGSTQGWSIEGADVKSASGSATGSATGANHTVAVVTDLGQVEFATSTPVTDTTVDAGKTNTTLGTYKFKAIDQDIVLKKVTFTQIGTIDGDDLQNFKLVVGGVQYDGVKALLSNNVLTFDLSKDSAGNANADGGVKILSGQTKFFDIMGDIVGGTSRTFKFSVQNQEDVLAWDNGYKVYVGAAEWSTNAFSVQTLAQTTINDGTLTFSLASDSPSGNVAATSTGVLLAKFKLTASGEDSKVTSLSVFGTGSDSASILKNVKLVLDGQQVGSTVASSTAVGSSGTTVDSDFTFTNNFIVRVGKPSVLEVYADLTDATIGVGKTISVGLQTGSNNVQGLISLDLDNSTSVSGNTLTVKSGAPTVRKNNSMTNATTTAPTGVLNSRDVRIGSLVVAAGAGEGAKISSIALTDHVGGGLSAYFSNLRLRDSAGKDLATPVGTLSGASSTYTFTLTSPITVQKGQEMVVDVVADILSTTSGASITATAWPAVNVASGGVQYQTIETGLSGTAPSSALSLQNVFIANKGSVSAAFNSNTPSATQLVMGSLAQPVFKFDLNAGKVEDINITELTTTVTISASTTPTAVLKNIKLMDGDVVLGAVSDLSVTNLSTVNVTSTAYAKFSALNLTVPKNGTKTLTVVADVNSESDIFSGLGFTFYVMNSYDADNSAAIVAKGLMSGQSVTPTISTTDLSATAGTGVPYGRYMTVFRTKISVAHHSGAPSGVKTKEERQVVAKYVVSNTANALNAKATLTGFNVIVSTSISQAAGTNTDRVITIYADKDGITDSTTQVAQTTFSPHTEGPTSTLGPSNAQPAFGTTSAMTFTSHEITAGNSTIVTVELDTRDAAANNTVTVGMNQGYIIWKDGYTSNINLVNTLPLTGKTISY